MFFKSFWVMRALIYKPFFGAIKFPSYIGKPIFLGNPSKIYIGKKVRIFPHARLECIGKNAKIIIEDNVSIGHNLHMTAAASLKISRDCTISSNVLITDIRHSYKEINQHIMNQPLIIRQTIIGENCFIGTGSVLDAGTILGRQCVVGANSVLTGEYPDYSVIVGSPARVVKRYDKVKNIWRNTDPKGDFIIEI